jgi:hypothetical protein
MRPDDIERTTKIEALVDAFPEAVPYLASQQGLHVLCCGLPVWATLEQVVRTKKLDADVVLASLKRYLAARG